MSTMPYVIHHRNEEPRSESLTTLLIFSVLTALFVGFVFGYHFSSTPKVQTSVAATTESSAPQTNIVPPPPAVVTPAVTFSNMVHHGEGIESPLIRQLIADPSIAGFSGNQEDAAAVKQWAGRQAHLLAIKAGLVDWKLGKEMWIAGANTSAFVIEKNAAGELTIAHYTISNTTTAGALSYSHTVSYDVAATVATSHFIGPMDGTLQFHTDHMFMHP